MGSSLRTIKSVAAGYFAGLLILVPSVGLGFILGKGSVHQHSSPVYLDSPTGAAAYSFVCDHGIKVFTTPQGGIAVFPGGMDCHG